MPNRTVDEVIAKIRNVHRCDELLMPKYTGKAVDNRPRIALGVASMQHHTTDEGWLLTEGLRHAGYQVFGHGYPGSDVDVAKILLKVDPAVVFMQDIREWGEHCGVRDFRNPNDHFFRIELLQARDDVWKVGVSKDSHNSVELCNHSFYQIGCHAFQHTYHPRIVKHVNAGLRQRHLIRSWHCVNADVVPKFTANRSGCILSGAISPVYPLRDRIAKNIAKLPNVVHFGHPGYQRQRCHTPELLRAMSRFKVSIVTSSVFGYSLRKFAESTAAGCSVLTDLPVDEVMPEIDANFVRVRSDVSLVELRDILAEMQRNWSEERQRHFAERCVAYYDWRAVGLRLATDIEAMRIQHAS